MDFKPRSTQELADLLGGPPVAMQTAGSPVERAQVAFANGDEVFQLELDLMSLQPVVIPMHSARSERSTTDPSEIINAVCREGWELVTFRRRPIAQAQDS